MSYPRGTLDIAQVKDALYNWVRDATEGLVGADRIIWRNQSRPLPERPCIAMRITDGPRRVGYSDSITPQANGKFLFGGQRVMTVSVQVFGSSGVSRPGALQLATDLNSTLSLGTVLEELRKHGVSVQEQGYPLNISEVEESEYEERAQFDMLLGLAQNVLDDPGTIEHVEGAGSVSSRPVTIHVDKP